MKIQFDTLLDLSSAARLLNQGVLVDPVDFYQLCAVAIGSLSFYQRWRNHGPRLRLYLWLGCQEDHCPPIPRLQQ